MIHADTHAGLRRDAGMTIAELLIAVAIMAIVIAAAYAFASTMQSGQNVSDREAQLAKAIGTPLARMEKLALQNISIELNPAPTPYSMAIRTDQNLDDQLEEHIFTATTAGTITHTTYLLNSSFQRVGAAKFDGAIATSNRNRADNVPLFRYYDENRAQITDMDLVPSKARSVVIDIRATVGDRTQEQTTTVQFRNRD